MPVEDFIKTGDRSEMRYLTRPLSDQIARTFQEKWTGGEIEPASRQRAFGDMPAGIGLPVRVDGDSGI